MLLLNLFHYQFLLDINQDGGRKSLLSLDILEIYQTSNEFLHDYDSGWSDPVYSFDFTEDNSYILLDAGLLAGSGKGDMFAYIPKSN